MEISIIRNNQKVFSTEDYRKVKSIKLYNISVVALAYFMNYRNNMRGWELFGINPKYMALFILGLALFYFTKQLSESYEITPKTIIKDLIFLFIALSPIIFILL